MLTKSEVIAVAENYVRQLEKESGGTPVIIQHEATIEKPYGYVFFFDSIKFLETRDYKYAILGNAPFLVENETGKIIEFGTAHETEYYINEYEAGRWPDNRRMD